MLRFPLLFLYAGLSIALLAAIVIVEYVLQPPRGEMEDLILFMLASGVPTVTVGYLIHRYGIVKWFTSLRSGLLMSIIITVLLVMLNVWVTAQLMYISNHDFVLTSALLVFSGLTAVCFGLLIANAFTAQLSQLSIAAGDVAQGKLETRLHITRNDELADFARTFNWMAESLQELDQEKRLMEQARRDLIAGVSHDLRTPLTTLRAMLEAIDDGIVDDEERMRYVRNSLLEVENLNTLINDLFELARLDAGHLALAFEDASLRDLISDAISSMNAKASKNQQQLTYDVSEDIDPVYMAPDKIQRVLHNLLDNALRYTPESGQITLRALKEGDQVRVDVHNTGVHIEDDHLPHIFDRFYRVEVSRMRDRDGRRSTGLGLAIARGFVEAHGGNIMVESSPDSGTVFRFTLPLKQNAMSL